MSYGKINYKISYILKNILNEMDINALESKYKRIAESVK